MFGRIFSMGGDPEVERRYALFRQAALEIVRRAQGLTGERWEGPGSSQASGAQGVSAQVVIPDIARIMTREMAEFADSDRHIRSQLVGGWVNNDVSPDDVNLYLSGVLGAIEQILGRTSPECRQMASVMGFSQHDMLGDQHVRNGRYTEAESEFRLALEMAHLSPDGRAVVAQIKVADMMRVQGRHPEAKRLFREALLQSDRLDPDADFSQMALSMAQNVHAQLAQYFED